VFVANVIFIYVVRNFVEKLLCHIFAVQKIW